jgi:hypothetical protein
MDADALRDRLFLLNNDVHLRHPYHEGSILQIDMILAALLLNSRIKGSLTEEVIEDLPHLSEGEIFKKEDREYLVGV